MQNVTLNIEKLGEVGKHSAAREAAQKAIYVENENAKNVYCITVSGAYERKYCFVTELSAIDARRVLADGDMLIVCLWMDIVVIDLPADKIRKVVTVTRDLDMFGIYKFKGGYFVHGEMTNRYFDGEFNLLWDASGRDIFFCPDRETSVVICDDHIDVWDFLGFKYSYDEYGSADAYWPSVLRKHGRK